MHLNAGSLELVGSGSVREDRSDCREISGFSSARTILLQEVVITGVGTMLPHCDSRDTFWQQLREGESQLDIEHDPVDQIPRTVGRIGDFSAEEYLEGIDKHLYRSCHREQLLYLCSLTKAARDAGLNISDLGNERVGLFDGTSRGNIAYWYDQICRRQSVPGSRYSVKDISAGMLGQAVGIAASILGVRGPTYTFNGTCASGAIAIGHAFREVQLGNVDIALGTGHDSALIEPVFQMYRDAGLLSKEGSNPRLAIRPYTGHCLNAFGEGAVTVVMESESHARHRGAQPLAKIAGYRYANGGEHPTDVDFTGDHPARLALEALKETAIGIEEVDFVLGHGNGVRASDISELNYMKRLFGRRTRSVPLISTKPVYGHTLGASSALNVAAAALMLHHGCTIPTVGADAEATVHGFNHQASGAELRELRAGLVIAYGIGGQNAVLALSKVK